jgi:SAM-dependent methyltransferase
MPLRRDSSPQTLCGAGTCRREKRVSVSVPSRALLGATIPRIVARQLSRPTGLLGALIRRGMNRRNAEINAFVVRQLELAPTNRVLEIGFGGGAAIPSVLEGAAFVGGVDRSADVVARIEARHATDVASGRAQFREGHVESLPFETASFDKAFTVHTVYFWTSLDAGFTEIHRVLAPGGQVAVGFVPKERMDRMGFPSDIFTPRTPHDVVASLTKAGFRSVRVERPSPATLWNVVVAHRNPS